MKKLILCRPRGFCAGVVRAIEIVEKSLQKWGPPIYVKHEIVHNRHVVEALRAKGAIFVDDIEEVPPQSRLIYSAHGVSPSVREAAKRRGLYEIDATCGLVTKVHSATKRFVALGYHVILIGHRKHVEIIGTAGEAPLHTTVVENCMEIEALPFPPTQKLAYVTQTTLSIHDVVDLVAALKKKYPHIITMPSSSICYATTNRQRALQHVVSRADLVFVVGDPASSNSNRLREIAVQGGVPAYLINEAREIDLQWIKDKETIAITAGASTPESIVQQVIAFLQTIGTVEVEEVEFVQENVVFALPSFLQEPITP